MNGEFRWRTTVVSAQQGPEASLCSHGPQRCVHWDGACLCGSSSAAGEPLLCIVAPKPTFSRLALQCLKDTAGSKVVPKARTSPVTWKTSEGPGKAVVEVSLASRWQLTCICENICFALV